MPDAVDRDQQAAEAKTKRQFPRQWLDEATPRPASAYLFKGLLDEGGVGLVYGPPGCGKSFLVIDLLAHFAAGLPWRGRRMPGGLAVYIAAEAGESILRRFVAWRECHVSDAREARVPLVIVTRGANLLDEVEAAELVGALKSIVEEAGMPLKLMVIDTLSRSIPGGDENSAHDMSRVVAFADRIRTEMGAGVLVVHHEGKDATKGGRGWSGLSGAADLVIKLAEGVATVEKVRDGVAGEQFAFALEVVEMGTDPEGEPITTCLVRHLDAAPTRTAPKKKPPGKNQKVVYDVLRRLVDERGELMPETSAIPRGARAVRFPDLVDAAAPKFPGLAQWRAKDRISQALVGLLQAGNFVGVHNELVWIL